MTRNRTASFVLFFAVLAFISSVTAICSAIQLQTSFLAQLPFA